MNDYDKTYCQLLDISRKPSMKVGAHISNSLPGNIKSTDSIYELKNFLKRGYGCKCYLCIG